MKSLLEFLRLTKSVRKRKILFTVVYLLNFIKLSCLMVQPIIFSYFIIDKVINERNIELLFPVLLVAIVLAVVGFVLEIVLSVLLRTLYIHRVLDTRDLLLKHMRHISIYDIEKDSPAKFQMLLGEDTHSLGSFFTFIIYDWVSQLFLIVFGILALFFMNWMLGVAGVVIIFLLIGLPVLVSKALSKQLERVRTHREEIGQILFEAVEGSKEIKTLGLEAWEAKKNKKVYDNLAKASVLDAFFMAISSETTRLVIGIILTIVYWLGANLIFQNHLTVGLLVLAVMYLEQTLRRIQIINERYGDFRSAIVSAKRVVDFLHIEVEPACKVQPEVVIEKEKLGTSQRPLAVKTKNVSLTLGGVRILNNVEIEVEEGAKVAIVGMSGSGKTSFYKILQGFIPLQEGEVLLGSRSISSMTRQELNLSLGCVSQAPFLFKGTLLENIAIGDLERDREEIERAAREANLTSLIEKLPEGLETELTNKGLQLSGGERQRVAIARMLLRRPKVLLLDEPTSALDRMTEREVIDALDRLMVGQTTIISTHRLETIQNANRIYVMDHGEVVAHGTHELLLDQSPEYRKMVQIFSQESHDGKKNI